MEALDELLQLDLLRTTAVPGASASAIRSSRRAVYEAAAPAGGSWLTNVAPRRSRHGAPQHRPAPTTSSARRVKETSTPRRPARGRRGSRPAGAGKCGPLVRRRTAPPPRRRPGGAVELLFARARALTAVGRFDGQPRALLEALEILPDGSDAMRARLSRACAGVESLLGQQEQAATVSREPSRISRPGSPEAVAIMLELIVNAFCRARFEAMHAAAERAVDASRRLGDAPLTAAALASSHSRIR